MYEVAGVHEPATEKLRFDFFLIVWVEHWLKVRVRCSKILKISFWRHMKSNSESFSHEQGHHEIICNFEILDSPICGLIYGIFENKVVRGKTLLNGCFFYRYLLISFGVDKFYKVKPIYGTLNGVKFTRKVSFKTLQNLSGLKAWSYNFFDNFYFALFFCLYTKT